MTRSSPCGRCCLSFLCRAIFNTRHGSALKVEPAPSEVTAECSMGADFLSGCPVSAFAHGNQQTSIGIGNRRSEPRSETQAPSKDLGDAFSIITRCATSSRFCLARIVGRLCDPPSGRLSASDLDAGNDPNAIFIFKPTPSLRAKGYIFRYTDGAAIFLHSEGKAAVGENLDFKGNIAEIPHRRSRLESQQTFSLGCESVNRATSRRNGCSGNCKEASSLNGFRVTNNICSASYSKRRTT